LDTGKVSTFDAFVQNACKALAELGAGQFDYLINNAGISHHAAFEKVTEEDLDSLYQVHVKGVFFLTQKLLPLMNDGGRILMLSSGTTRILSG
jgi:NAD(P)-dependent dehydrogenase (short-subunit alcohol dehydrogenase family)